MEARYAYSGDEVDVDRFPFVYTDTSDVRAGDTVALRISSPWPQTFLTVYRLGLDAPVAQFMVPTGKSSVSRYDSDWDWPAFVLPVPVDWSSGIYVARLDEVAPKDALKDRRYGQCFFCVLSTDSPATIIYKVPSYTYAAYNLSGGGCLYGTFDTRLENPRSPAVSLNRPGCGTGGPVKGNEDTYDRSSPRQTVFHWDLKFVEFFQELGVRVDYVTDYGLDTKFLDPSSYALMVAAGHDEYWTIEQRSRISNFLEEGGRYANFGGNTCWWVVQRTGSLLSCQKFSEYDATDTDPDLSSRSPGHWWHVDPPARMLGSSYVNGGARGAGQREAVGFVTQEASHWAFEGTGLAFGDSFGREEHLIGYECDGIDAVKMNGFWKPTGEDDAPQDVEILAHAQLSEDSGWARPYRPMSKEPLIAMTLTHVGLGTLFHAATTDWVRVSQQNAAVHRITRNVVLRWGSNQCTS